MKILHINSYYSVSKFYKNLYNKQKNNGLDIEVYVPVGNKIENYNYDFGSYTKIVNNYNKFDRFIFYIKHKKILYDIKEKYHIPNFQLIHAHSLFSNGYIAYKLNKSYGIPYIVAVRNTDVNIFFKYAIHMRKIGREILKNADKIIFLSNSYRDTVMNKYIPDRLKDIIKDKIEIIPNGIDEFWFMNKGVEKKIKHTKKITILYVGGIDKNKNILTTVKAIKILMKKGYNIDFIVTGKIKDYKIYKKLISNKFVYYNNPIEKEELIDVYKKSDIFVMPSITETFGLVYAEAMSQGLPVIYSKNQGFDGQFKNGEVGFAVESKNELELSEKILQIIDNYFNISKTAIDNVNKFSWDKIENEYNNIYSNILKKF